MPEKNDDLVKLIKDGFAGVHARFTALNEGLVFVAKKVLAPGEVVELERIWTTQLPAPAANTH